ncbi:MAG: hypothetical protein BAJATHORv1_70035 [Candidatus Thorarchaeota archaeon]|nr:MAG: hypothetical protein BAJATHORv1_70035 [Candidatus Thorarchaeota archaeon]
MRSQAIVFICNYIAHIKNEIDSLVVSPFSLFFSSLVLYSSGLSVQRFLSLYETNSTKLILGEMLWIK